MSLAPLNETTAPDAATPLSLQSVSHRRGTGEKTRVSLFILGASLSLLAVGCSKRIAGPNQALLDYLGEPVAPPANMDAAYSKQGLTSAMQDISKAANVSLTKVEIDNSEFPYLVGVVFASRGGVGTRVLELQNLL